MSRTFRNKSTVPHGWSVRDNGHAYYGKNDRWGRDHLMYELDGRYYYRSVPSFRRCWMQKERTEVRRHLNRMYRAKTRNLLRLGRYDDILPPSRTSGWNTW